MNSSSNPHSRSPNPRLLISMTAFVIFIFGGAGVKGTLGQASCTSSTTVRRYEARGEGVVFSLPPPPFGIQQTPSRRSSQSPLPGFQTEEQRGRANSFNMEIRRICRRASGPHSPQRCLPSSGPQPFSTIDIHPARGGLCPRTHECVALYEPWHCQPLRGRSPPPFSRAASSSQTVRSC